MRELSIADLTSQEILLRQSRYIDIKLQKVPPPQDAPGQHCIPVFYDLSSWALSCRAVNEMVRFVCCIQKAVQSSCAPLSSCSSALTTETGISSEDTSVKHVLNILFITYDDTMCLRGESEPSIANRENRCRCASLFSVTPYVNTFIVCVRLAVLQASPRLRSWLGHACTPHDVIHHGCGHTLPSAPQPC